MRRIVSVLLFLVGAAAIVVGVGKVSFLSPEKTLSASVTGGTQDAPVTLLTQSLRDATAGDAKVTVHAEGAFTAALGRAADVDAWVADAAANVVTGVDRKTHSFQVTHRSGVSTTPNPAGSDLWITEESHEGDWEASWTVPSQGEWTMLLATDGATAAPMNISMTWDNPAAETGAKWRTALPWLVGGVLALALGALVLMSRPRRPRRKKDLASSPRRAARYAAETGQLPVVTPAVPGAAAAVIPAGAEDPAALAPSVQAARAAAEEPHAMDETMIHPRLVASDAAEAPLPAEDAWGAAAERAQAGEAAELTDADAAIDEALAPFAEPAADPADASRDEEPGEDEDRDGDDSGDASGGTQDYTGHHRAPLAGDADPTAGERPARSERVAAQASPRRRAVRFGAAVLAAVGLVLPATPAIADESTPASDASSTPSGSGQSSGTDAAGSAALPVILQEQLDRILKDVAAGATAGDKSKDVKELQARFSGSALEVRKEYYEASAKGVTFSAAPVQAIVAEPIKAAAVTTTTQWPRTVMVVTQATPADTPVVLTLEQLDARSNYKVISAVGMVPGVSFPGVALGSTGVTTQADDVSGLVAKPTEVLDGFSDWVGNAKSSWNDKFEASDFVTALREQLAAAQKANESEEQRAKNQMTFEADPSATRAISAPQGGSLVTGYVTATNTIAPDDNGTVSLTDQLQKLTGTKDKTTKKNLVVTYRMPVVFYVPASGSGEKIRLVAASFVLASASLK
ncbi:hypothetical protein [Galactobacter valiniphilus]|uniref:hypothetical protein n=1 Tax=Galactobacter valiniphilus TaxID=2676122 RepID=UPI0037368A5E